MSQYIVSARKYRPQRFSDVMGQDHIGQTLKNALKFNKLAHAFLFTGPRGVGKTTCARILAKVINCEQVTADFEPCDTCPSCTLFNQNATFNIIELDAASNNGVEHIRSLIDQVRVPPQQGKFKVFIIDEVHMLSSAAFNAFLKTLEEPPAHVIFILATTEKHKILPTILSRCQVYDFKRISPMDAVKQLEVIAKEEKITVDKNALHIIGQKADGAMRDALSIFDRLASFGGNTITYEDVLRNLNVLDYDYFFRCVDLLMLQDAAGLLNVFEEIMQKGFDPEIFVGGLAEHLRNLLVCHHAATAGLLEVPEGIAPRYQEQARQVSEGFLVSCLDQANHCEIQYRLARNKRLHVEIALIKMARIMYVLTADEKKKQLSPVLN